MQWCLVMAMTAAGFAVMMAPVPFFQGTWAGFLPVLLFPAIPLLGLAFVARKHWTAIFRKVIWRSILLMFGFAILNIAITMPIGMVVMKYKTMGANPIIGQLAKLPTQEKILLLVRTVPSLFGEEVMSILPFLALLWLLTAKLKFSRTTAIVGAWLISAMLFGLAHLTTYNWDLVQCMVLIGSARIALTLAYIFTKNIWVSTGAHIINDWGIFGVSMLGASLQNL